MLGAHELHVLTVWLDDHRIAPELRPTPGPRLLVEAAS